MPSLTPNELAELLAAGQPLCLLDVRRRQAREASGLQIAGAQWQDPALWLDWKDAVPHDRPVLLYCAHGQEISQGLTAALRVMGADARHLEGGFSAWQAQGLATLPTPPATSLRA